MTLSATALVNLTQAKNYLRVDAAASLHVDAEYVSVGDVGGTVEFDLANIPIEGSLKLYVVDRDPALQVEDTDFTISGLTITFTEAPTSGKAITASYDHAAEDDTFESYDDDLLERLIVAATKKSEDYTGRAFIQREIVETRIGDGTKTLKLYKMPVDDVTSITVGGDALIEWSERLSIGRIYHLIAWELDAEIIITYDAGYDTDRTVTQALVPDAVIAVLIAVAAWYENRMGIKSQNISGIGSVDYGDLEGLPEASKRKLDSLRVSVI